ncbi:MAG: Hint domain-containing protein [Arenibacterium sp.]
MGTGFTGAFVISWAQTEVDGLDAAPLEALDVGAAWSWRGDAVCVDGPADVLRLDDADGATSLRQKAARKVRRLVGTALENAADLETNSVNEPLMDCAFVVTNGSQSFTVTVIDIGKGHNPLLMFVNEIPPSNTDLWVVHQTLGRLVKPKDDLVTNGVICFTPGTRISTPDGPRAVETLCPGDEVLTRDNGPQEIQWTGARRMSGARLFVMPGLRPIRLRAGALGIEEPDQELVVSPEHRWLIGGRTAQALFNTSEVLVASRDLVNDNTIHVDYQLREVTYVHLLLPSHQIIWANGVETESFHPASADLTSLSELDRKRLLAHAPDLDTDPHLYGAFARRMLSKSESAILRYERQ